MQFSVESHDRLSCARQADKKAGKGKSLVRKARPVGDVFANRRHRTRPDLPMPHKEPSVDEIFPGLLGSTRDEIGLTFITVLYIIVYSSSVASSL